MSRHIVLGIALALCLSTAANAGVHSPSQSSCESAEHTVTPIHFGASPVTFTENRGQWDESVKFKANAAGAAVWFTARGMRCQFVRTVPEADQLVVGATMIGANPCPRVYGEDVTAYTCNYFFGNDPNRWHTRIPNYGTIVFENIYDGIDLKYYGDGKQLEYDFVVSPGADVARIEIEYDGIERLSVGEAGGLVVETAWGTVHELAPVVYQKDSNRIIPITGAYRLASEKTFGFELGPDYNPALPVVIDPVLLFGTYLGGSGIDEAYAVSVDGDQNIYVTGKTYSLNFPTHSNFQGPAGIYDVFITKFDRYGGMVYSTYLGGGGGETGYGIAVDDAGYAYVTGATASTYFPTKNPYKDGPLTCDGDAFVTKLGAAGDTLVFSTYLGGSDVDWGKGIAVDDLGYVYVGGQTQSSDFPTVNPYQTFQGIRDATVTKFCTTGDSLIYSTYLGGSAIEGTWDMALGDDGTVYITGETQSVDYPTVNAYQTDQGNQDVFLTRLNATGDDVIYSTYLGGGMMDVGTDVAVDEAGNAYVTGWTQSFDFPIVNQFQTNMNYDDVFVTKFNATGETVVYSTYLGGNSYEIGWDIDVDAGGHAYVTGWTLSTDFPTQDPYQTDQDTTDAFLVKLDPAGNTLDFGTYLGGDGWDEAWGLALDASGNAYVAGRTQSTDFPTQNPYQYYQEGTDAFVAVISQAAVSVNDDVSSSPERFALYQNVPNPFNPTTWIRYEVPSGGGVVSITIYDVEGRLVRTLISGSHTAGPKTLAWDGKDDRGKNVVSGVYFYRMLAPGFDRTMKMVLLR
jgi:hypothetical protein